MQIERKIASMGVELVAPSAPLANFVQVQRSGNLLFVAGHLPRKPDGDNLFPGKVGREVTVEQGYEAARWCALNLLARMKAELGDLDRVTRILKVVGMVNSPPDFEEQAGVVDGASDLFVAVFGEAGRHSRSAPGMAVLPRDTAVIVDCVIEVAGD